LNWDVYGLRLNLLCGENFNVAGLDLGLVNGVIEKVSGVQVAAMLNVSEKVRGVQIGLLNFMKDGFLPFFPLINFNFPRPSAQ
jgi:hypothetical protein